MRIKLHNSIGKTTLNSYLLDNEIVIGSYNGCLLVRYRIDDWHCFLSFSPEKKELKEWSGFGEKSKSPDPDWWKRFNWKEMSA